MKRRVRQRKETQLGIHEGMWRPGVRDYSHLVVLDQDGVHTLESLECVTSVSEGKSRKKEVNYLEWVETTHYMQSGSDLLHLLVLSSCCLPPFFLMVGLRTDDHLLGSHKIS